MESKKFNLSKIFNVVTILLAVTILATLIGASLFAPIATVKAITKSQLTSTGNDGYNIHFVTAKTDSSVTTGLKLEDSKYTYNRVESHQNGGNIFYYGDYGATTYSDNFGSLLLQENNDYSLLLQGDTKFKNNQFIPTNTTHYKNVSGEFEEIFYDDTDENGFVFLNNYYSSLSPETPSNEDQKNYESFYLAFGSPYSANEDRNYVREFTVSGMLYNTSGETHTLSLPSPINDEIDQGSEKLPITYWYQYFDLTNIKGDNGNSEYTILNQEGKYEINFTDIQYYDNKGNQTLIGSYTYTFYLLDSANYTYPVINGTNTNTKIIGNDQTEYSSQAGMNDAYITYDASRYKVDFSRLNYEYSENVTTSFKTVKYKYGNKDLDMGIITYSDSFKEASKRTIKESYILTHRVNDTKIEYMYLTNNDPYNVKLTKTTATNVEYEYDYSDIVSLINSDKLSYEYIRVEEIAGASGGEKYDTYIINDYPADINSPFNIDLSEKTAKESISIPASPTDRKVFVLKENVSKLQINYLYDMPIDELGEYSFNYTYICPTVEDGSKHTTNTNISPIKFKDRYFEKDGVDPTQVISDPQNLYLTVWGNLDENNRVILNGTTYSYTKVNNIEKINGFEFTADGTWTNNVNLTPNGNSITAELILSTTASGSKRVSIRYKIGTFTTSTTTNKYFLDSNYDGVLNEDDGSDAEGYPYYEEILTTHTYTLASQTHREDLFTEDNQWTSINKILSNIPQTGTNSNTIFKTINNIPVQDEEVVYSFGSIAYFNKDDSTTDSGYAKLQEMNKRKGFDFSADITNRFGSVITTKDSAKINIENGTINYENIVNTNAVPVLWRNYSNVITEGTDTSYIYHYNFTLLPQYDEDENLLYTKIVPGTETSIKYNKDSYCGENGLYIIVVKYKLATAPLGDTYTQVFTFIIDNTSPTFDIHKEIQTVDDGGAIKYEYKPLDEKYTNKNVRITWNIPNVFQYNVYIEIEQRAYDNKTVLFKGEYFNENNPNDKHFTYKSADFTTCKDEKGKYIVTINSTALANGKYFITIHYGKNSNSSTTKTFFIDNQAIENMNIYGVYEKTAKGSTGYYVDITSPLNQLTNQNFTFRYNAKASGAPINTYYHKIGLTKDTDNLSVSELTANNKSAITNQYKILGTESTIDLSKYYNYTYEKGRDVDTNNCFINSNSCIYLFKLEDLAGNTASFVVFFDKTSPSYIITPEVENPSTRIINQTTKIIWGDYKAIFIDAPATGIDLEKPKNKLDEVLREIHLATTNESQTDDNKFNQATIETISGKPYIYIPLTTKIMENTNSDNNIISHTKLNNYYLFPVNPVSGGKITLLDESNPYTIAEGLTSGNPIKGKYIAYLGDNGTDIEGMIGSGVYVFTVADKLGNSISSLLWMNLDATQTLAYGLFNNENYISDSNILFNESPDTYALNELYISSLPATPGNNNDIPEYELTYTYYPINTSIYGNIENIEYVENGKETYLNIKISGKANTIKYLVTDEDGNNHPLNSFPYDLEGTTSEHVYGTNNSLATKYDDSGRIITKELINPTYDSVSYKKVTKEGFYVFRRIYTENVELPKNDSRIIYRSYYVDRNGIIDTSSSMKIGSDIGFTLGAELSKEVDNTQPDNEGYREIYNYERIYNNIQTSEATSNANHTTSTLFTTNKMLLNYRLTSDKYDYEGDFYKKYYNGDEAKLQNWIGNSNNSDKAKTSIINTLFNKNYFSNIIYKLDLALYLGNFPTSEELNDTGLIIDENSLSVYGKNIANYFAKNSDYTGNNVRSNNLFLYFGDDENNYNTKLSDQAKRWVINADGSAKQDLSYANQLTMSFQIVHNPPEGDAYGKLYGNQHETNYDDDTSESGTNSLPMESFEYYGQQNPEEYALLYKYLDDLVLLSDGYKNTEQTKEGSIIALHSTNNKTLIFVFIEEVQDKTKAKIDPNNISIWQAGENSTKADACIDNNLIFRRKDSSFIGNTRVSADTMKSAFITNVINNIIYHAVIIFDDNLDEIYSETEKHNNNQPGKLKYRLLDSNNNPDNAKYYVQIQYVGNEANYKGNIVNNNYDNEDKNSKAYIEINYFRSTYEISIDRRKPNYNLTKLMEQDKYYDSNVKDSVTSTNHNSVFESYKQYYNITDDSENGYTSSELGKYFFAVDSRPNSNFVFESVSPLDNNEVIYFRKISDISNYKYSITPDNHEVYNGGTDYAIGHPRFSTTTAITLNSSYIENLYSGLQDQTTILDETFYKLEFGTKIGGPNNKFNDERYSTENICISKLIQNKVFEVGGYYEIIESDEAGNYRVYGIYIPTPDSDSVSLTYKETSNASKNLTLKYNTSTANIGGTNITFTNYTTNELYLRTNIKFDSEYHKYNIAVTYQPIEEIIYIHYTGFIGNTAIDYKESIKNVTKDKFLECINKIIADKSSEISNSGYSKYGHSITITFINRIGLHTTLGSVNLFEDFTINYLVAGNTIEPEFPPITTPGEFEIKIPGKGEGKTYITDLNVYKFNDSKWESEIHDKNGQPFSKTEAQFIKGTSFRLSYGVWKFELTDNFNRKNTYFHELLEGPSSAGGDLTFQTKYEKDGNSYITGNNTYYSYNHQSYCVYIKFYGNYYESVEGELTLVENKDGKIIYTPNDVKNKDYSMYGIQSVTTNNNITTITFTGINELPYSRYEIKTVFAGTSDNYEWGLEETLSDSDLIVYNKDFTIYKAIQSPVIKNLNGSIIDISTSSTINLTEDVQIIAKWDDSYTSTKDLKPFNSKIVLTRIYTESGKKLTETTYVDTGYKIDKFGTYTAYIENSLGVTSNKIQFVRTKDTITQYAIYTIDNVNNTEEQLIESNYISQNTELTQTVSIFNYYTTEKYFSFIDSENNKIPYPSLESGNEINYENNDEYETPVVRTNTESNYFIETRVSSNLNLFAQLNKVATNATTGLPSAEYLIYTTAKATDEDDNELIIKTPYRYLVVHFLPTQPDASGNYPFLSFLDTKVNVVNNENNLAEGTNTIKSTEKSLQVTFSDKDTVAIGSSCYGNTIYIDRYYNSEFVETIEITRLQDRSKAPLKDTVFTISTVGLHTFKLRDMAKREHLFNIEDSSSTSLNIYLVNEVLYLVNDENPINNQIFNNDVKLQVLTELSGQSLYKNNISYTVYKNGIEIKPEIADNTMIFTEHGYYTIYMDATTELFQEGTISTDKEVSSVYNFVIIKENISMKSFGISNGKFVLDSLTKISEGYSTPLNYYNPNSLLWLTYEAVTPNDIMLDEEKIYGNAKYEVTLKYYDENLKSYRPFTFKVWISGDTPNILSSVSAGTSTTDNITITYNPGLIYSQRGKCYIKLNGETVETIDETSDIIPQTITISKKGEYMLEIYSADDETLILSSKYIKKEPFNTVTKIILICVGIGVVVLVGVFFFIRRKGKYR